jgi:hypothetical protein
MFLKFWQSRRARDGRHATVQRATVRRALIAMLPVVVLLAPTPGHAQSFFEKLFGGGGGSKPAPTYNAPQQRLLAPGNLSGNSVGTPHSGGGNAYRAPSVSPYRSHRDRDDDDDGSAHKDSKGAYRTVCVRTCDGFFWPVSFQAKRSQFQKDARACQSSCGGEATLFHYPNQGEIADAVDNAGRPYGRLPAAFLYRKKLVAGCTCRPEAWSPSEVGRHQTYADIEATEKARKAEAEAAELARVAAAEAAQAEADKRVADAKMMASQGKTPGARKNRKTADAAGPEAPESVNVAVTVAAPPGKPGPSNVDAVNVATGVPVGVAVAQADHVEPPAVSATATAVKQPPAHRSRRRNDGVDVAAVTRTSGSAGRSTPPDRQRSAYAAPSASVGGGGQKSAGLFGLTASKYKWPGD